MKLKFLPQYTLFWCALVSSKKTLKLSFTFVNSKPFGPYWKYIEIRIIQDKIYSKVSFENFFKDSTKPFVGFYFTLYLLSLNNLVFSSSMISSVKKTK
jgi:hypothetical protein